MRLVPIKEVLTMAGENVPCCRGQITDVTKQLAGGEGEKAWRFQKLTIRDDSGEIKVKIWDREAYPVTIKGQIVTLTCKDGEKGLSGVKAKEDEYRGATSTILNVTPSGIIELGNGQPAPQAAPVSQPAQTATPPQNGSATAAQQAPASPAAQQAPASPPAQNGNGHAATDLLNTTALAVSRDYYRVMDAVQTMRLGWDAKHPDHKMSPDHFQSAVATVFIHCDKRGLINGH
jgi:hypothetical protein